MGVMLIVDDDVTWARKFFPPLLGNAWEIQLVSSVWETISLLEQSPRLAGAIVDVLLPDGCGVGDLVPLLRGACPRIPVMILSGYSNGDVINMAHLFGAEYVAKKPGCAENVRLFAARVLGEEHASAATAKERALRIRALADEHALTPRQVEILTLAAQGLAIRGIGDRLGIRCATVKTHVHAVLARTGHASLRGLVHVLTPNGVSS